MLSHACCRRICERVKSTGFQISVECTLKVVNLRMIDLDCMIKSLRLAWLQRIYDGRPVEMVPFSPFSYYNYEFCEEFASPKDWQNIIWNNRDVRIDGSAVFYKNFFLSGEEVNGLLFTTYKQKSQTTKCNHLSS